MRATMQLLSGLFTTSCKWPGKSLIQKEFECGFKFALFSKQIDIQGFTMQCISFLKTGLAGIALAASALVPLQASADVLYNAAWVDTPYGWQSDLGSGAWTTTASVGGPSTITSLSWWGYYAASAVANEVFAVTFGSTPLNGTLSALSAGTVNNPLTGPVSVSVYTLLLDAPLAFAGGAVDVSILNSNGSVFLEWFWLDAGTDPGSLPNDILPSSLVIEGQRRTSSIPEPGTLALAGAAGAWLLLRRRRTAAPA